MTHNFEFGKWLSHPLPGEEVAITGISGRFPESHNVHEFKENLFNKIDTVTEDDRRWKLHHPEIPPREGKINDIDKLDCGYFGLHYRQAGNMNPMMRKLLECAVEAIMDAGVNPSELEGSKTAVVVGANYYETEKEGLLKISESQCFGLTGYLKSFVSHRISYFLKLKGPSMMVDTASNSSLNAFEHAFKYIRMGHCDNVIVGGINLLMQPEYTRQYFRLGVLSSSGISKVFDEEADGFVRSEATVCFFLQKSKCAKRIYAQVIHSKGSCDGFKSLGITFPSSQMQQELMTDVLQESGVNASDISFLEAHCTGTKVGDPQEIEAIDEAIAKRRTEPLLVGSVKSGIGHTESASGLCSIVKVIIAMETGYIPPNIHLKTIKKGMLGLEEGRMKVVTETTEVDRNDATFAVNNFGYGGSNCHLLLNRFNKVKTNQRLSEDRVSRLICVSGRTKKAVLALLDYVNKTPLDNEYVGLLHQIFKKDVPGHIYRGYTIISNAGPIKTSVKSVTNRNRLCVVFGNMEKGYQQLSKNLRKFPCFKTAMKKIEKVIKDVVKGYEGNMNVSMKSYLDIFGGFAVQIGIVELFKILETKPEAVYGDSIGKFVTAYYYGEITLKDAVHLIHELIGNNKEHDFSAGMKAYKNLVSLNVSDNAVNGYANCLKAVKNKHIEFLDIIGRLYEDGHNLQVHKLYPPVQFPVSRGTPMISPLVQWDYSKSFYTYKFCESAIIGATQREYNLSTSLYEAQKYMSGHVIDGRNLIPATEYLELVRRTFVRNFKMAEFDNVSIIFENCKFIKALTLPNKGTLNLLVTIQKSSGNFEVVEKKSVVVSGRIFLAQNSEQHENELPTHSINKKRKEFLEKDEIYRELNLRGYNYRDLFKSMVKCDVKVTVALIKWENNLTVFLDNMLQMKVLGINSRSLYIPIAIKRLTYNASHHAKFLESRTDFLCPVFYNKQANIIKCEGIEICGIEAVAILEKKYTASPVLEKYVFVYNKAEMALEQSIRVITQVIIENSLENDFKGVEIVEKDSELLLSSLISKVLEDVPSVVANLTVSSQTALNVAPGINVNKVVLTATSNLLLLIATNIFQKRNLLNQALSALSPDGFLLSRERFDFIYDKVANVELLLEHMVGKEKFILVRSGRPIPLPEVIEIKLENYDWLLLLQKALKKNVDVIVYSENIEPEGILGFVNCLRREPKGYKVKCFFMMDPSPKFDIKDPFYETQVCKQLAFNIYKDGKWGTYRHLLLDDVQNVEGRCSFLKSTVKGDLSSLRWVEGSLTSESTLNKESILVYPVYSSINFKDIMIASGRVSIDKFTLDRTEQECCQGIEFCGRDTNGRRVMGITTKAALSTIVVANKNLLWEVPQNWSFEDASTVIVAYATALYGLLKVAQLKNGMSVLIHSATDDIGLAALNICLYHCCDLYVTVDTEEKRQYVRKYFSQIPENHIGHSMDNSFVEMVKTGTNGRGVDLVLNCLSEESLKETIECVTSGGNILEIRKFDLGTDTTIDLLSLQRNINYHGILIETLFANSSELKIWIADKIYEGITLGYVKPLPRTIFKRDKVIEAYKFVTTGKHIGKVVIQMRDENEKKEIFEGTPRFFCDPQKSYIILGGLGGIGLEFADWLYIKGAKKLVLASRSGIKSGYQKQRIESWRSFGVTVQISTADITTRQGCLILINEAIALGPVDGIFNLAALLKDAFFENQNKETFNFSMAPKAQATIYLDLITRESCPALKYFVVFSSSSCGRGFAAQTNYGMANSVMERICEKRKRDGLSGLAIQWGPVSNVGIVAKLQKEDRELVVAGISQQKLSNCFEVLDKFLKQDNPVVSSMVVAEKTSKEGFKNAVEIIAYILGIKDIKTVDSVSTFTELGMDSMMGTEMIQILEKEFEIYLTAREIRNLTFAKLAELETQVNTKKDRACN